MSNLNQLLRESVVTADNSEGRPALLALTRATTQLIYSELVATQPTSQPEAALYGVKYLNPNKELSFLTAATYGGAIGTEARKTIPQISASALTFAKGDMFQLGDVVFKCLVDSPFDGTTETEENSIVSEALAAGNIRFVPEAANTEMFESTNPNISEAGFNVNRWKAHTKSRKFKTSLTVELAQDMQANGFDTPEMVEDILATQMAEEINKDVMQCLTTVSSRYKVEGVSDKGVLDLSAAGSAVEQGRELYRYICEMNASIQKNTSYSATYVVGSARVVAVLAASGWLVKKDTDEDHIYGTLHNGLKVMCDPSSPVEYVVVGVKADYGEQEMVGSLFYAPYIDGRNGSDPTDHVGAYKIVVDTSSMTPTVALLMRYALSVNPYTMGLDDEAARIIDSTDMDNFAGQSKMSVLLGVKLPKLEK